MQIHIPMIAEVKVLQHKNMLYVHHMHTLVCMVFKWNYEQHLYSHTLIPTDIRFAPTNVPLNRLIGSQHSHLPQKLYNQKGKQSRDNMANSERLALTLENICKSQLHPHYRTIRRCKRHQSTCHIRPKCHIENFQIRLKGRVW